MSKIKATANVMQGARDITVDIIWEAPVDRPHTSSISLPPKAMKLAQRLARAIEAQAIFRDVRIATDVHGQTYVACDCQVIGRTLNADLKRFGF